MTEQDYIYQPPPHRVALVGDAWDVVQERHSDGGVGPDGQPETVVEVAPAEAEEPEDAKPAKRSAKKG